MSKIGRRPIAIATAKVEIQGNKVLIQGPKAKFEHILPAHVSATLEGKSIKLDVVEKTRKNKMDWGLHRALLANMIKGAEVGFEKKLTIEGLGFKAQVTGNKIVFTLGYTHKIDFEFPKSVTVEVDKTGQQMIFRSSDRFVLGNVCDTIRSFRPPEPYKGTGIVREGDVIIRKAGKTKSA